MSVLDSLTLTGLETSTTESPHLGTCLKIHGGAVTWKSKKQGCVAPSTTEDEYIAPSSAAQESVWLRRRTSEPGSPSETPTTIF